MIDIRRLRHDEWRALRAIRLEAIEKSPEAFMTTLAEAEAFPDRVWKDRARMAALGSGQATAIAFDDTVPVGMATGLIRPDITPDVVSVVSVFVSPSMRRRGIAAAMLSIVEEWAADHGALQASLWVVETNAGARTFYEAIGYRETTDRQQMPTPPPRWEIRVVKTLRGSG